MPTSASHDTLDDAAFEAQLSNFDGSAQTTAGESGRTDGGFDPLDVAFPFDGTAAGSPRNPPESHPLHAAEAARQSSARQAPWNAHDRIARPHGPSRFAVAVVIAIGLAAGATAATFVFYDRAAPIIAAWTQP